MIAASFDDFLFFSSFVVGKFVGVSPGLRSKIDGAPVGMTGMFVDETAGMTVDETGMSVGKTGTGVDGSGREVETGTAVGSAKESE